MIGDITNHTMDNTITIQEVKEKGSKILGSKVKRFNEAFITVRGAKAFVVMSLEEHNRLRECELMAAFNEVKNDVKKRKFKVVSIKKHIKDLNV